MMYATEDEAVRAAESLTQAACDAGVATSYRVFRVGDSFRVTDGDAPRRGPRQRPCVLVAWFYSLNGRVKRLHVGR